MSLFQLSWGQAIKDIGSHANHPADDHSWGIRRNSTTHSIALDATPTLALNLTMVLTPAH